MLSGIEIRDLRKTKGLTQENLATQVGVSKTTVVDWEKGRYFPEGKNLINLAKALDVTVGYLMGETENPAPAVSPKHPEIESNATTINEAMMIPVVTDDVSACCGTGSIYAEDVKWDIVGYYPMDPNDLIGYTWQTKKFGVIRASGDSMEPRIHDGDRVVFAEEIELQNGDIAILLWEGRLMIRGVIFNRDGSIILKAINKGYDDITTQPNEDDRLCVLGKMLGIAPPFKVASSIW